MNASLVAGLLVLVYAGCGKRPESGGADQPLPTATVRAQPIAAKPHQTTEDIVGTVRARLRATLEAKVAGRIEAMPVVPGQAVKAGEVVATLEVREIQARLDQAKALRDQAERDRKRFDALLSQKAVTQAEYDGMEARARVAEASVKEAETMLGYAKVLAPFDGVISRKFADVGDLAAPGRPVAELEDPKALRLETDIPEALISHVELGTRLPVRISAVPAACEGVVAEMAPAADPNSRTFRVKLDLPSASGLRLGLFGRVAVPVGETTVPRVPASALVQRGQMELVFIVTEGRAQLRLVKAGKRHGDEVELVSGVSPGEQVVVEGAADLRDGQPLTLK